MTLIVALLLAQPMAHPCMTDAHKLCAGVQPGGGRIAACLKSHAADVSAECKAKMTEFHEEAMACQADVEKLCPNTKPGPERRQCMMEHKDQVSQQCRDLFAQMKERHEEAQGAVAACRDDAQKLCPKVKPGKGRMIQCLKQHQSDLSPDCSAALAK